MFLFILMPRSVGRSPKTWVDKLKRKNESEKIGGEQNFGDFKTFATYGGHIN
jgi:hypothetical protein